MFVPKPQGGVYKEEVRRTWGEDVGRLRGPPDVFHLRRVSVCTSAEDVTAHHAPGEPGLETGRLRHLSV